MKHKVSELEVQRLDAAVELTEDDIAAAVHAAAERTGRLAIAMSFTSRAERPEGWLNERLDVGKEST